MSYQVIARKYRPQTFDDVVGQRLVSETLKNAIETDRVAHGYIFSGARGVGKTTMARILAKALNCAHGPTVTPCGECPSCIEIAAGRSVDVLEIDAASNRGIDEIRELRDNVRYLPSRDRYKVFIIDEVHMLTTEAFNALLKTLEEPPERSLFILATTEAHRLPATIQSRCQHFAFRLLDYQEIVSRLKEICRREGVTGSESALGMIAQAAAGSMRDALSLLDQIIAACGNTLDDERVRRMLGVVPTVLLAGLMESIQSGDAAGLLEKIDQLASEGQDLAAFCSELTRFVRNLMIARSCGEKSALLEAPDSDRAVFAKLAASLSEEDLTRAFQVLLRAQNEMRTSLQPRFHLELALMKLAHAPKLVAIERLLTALKTQSAARGGGASGPPAIKKTPQPEPPAPKPAEKPPWERASAPAPKPAEKRPSESASASAPAPARQPEPAPSPTPAPGEQAADNNPPSPAAAADARFEAIKAVLFEASKFLGSCLNPVVGWRFDEGQVYFNYGAEGSWAVDLLKVREHHEKLRAACEKVLGEPVKIHVTLGTEASQRKARASVDERAAQSPAVAAFRAGFDCVVTELKDLSRE